MTVRLFILARIGISLLLLSCASCGRREKTYEEMSPRERLNHLRDQAAQVMLKESTNEVPGIHAIINVDANVFSDDSVPKWSGVVRLDYVNKIGGIERTNLHFKFTSSSGGMLLAFEDSEFYQAQFMAHLNELKQQAGSPISHKN